MQTKGELCLYGMSDTCTKGYQQATASIGMPSCLRTVLVQKNSPVIMEQKHLCARAFAGGYIIDGNGSSDYRALDAITEIEC